MRGFVYALSNVSMPDLVKIGRTTRLVGVRMSELFQSTGVPTPFELVAQVWTPDCAELEIMLHEHLAACRVSPDREFFRIEPRKAEAELRDIHREQIEAMLEIALPEQMIVPAKAYVDPSAIYSRARWAGVRPEDVASALEKCGPEVIAIHLPHKGVMQ